MDSNKQVTEKIYVMATKRLVQEVEKRVMKQGSPAIVEIIEFLLNEQGFTMDKDKARYI